MSVYMTQHCSDVSIHDTTL